MRSSVSVLLKFLPFTGVDRAYGSYEDLAKDPDVDLVYIANLHPQHKDTVLTMTKYKKHILCEKPLSVNRKETQVMIDAAKEADVFFMAGLWSRFFPAQKLYVSGLRLSFLPQDL